MADYSKFQGYIDPKEEIFYEPHESRVDGEKYQAVVPEINTSNKAPQFCKEDVNKQCVLMPMDVSYLHTSCVYDPAILSELDEKDVDEFIKYVHYSFGGDTNYYTHHNALEELAFNLIYRFQGDLKRARLYCDSCMSACGEMLMWKVEDSKGTGAKSSIHYHLDIPHAESEGMDSLSRVWCHWRDSFNKLVANHATFKEYEQCLVEAEKLIESYGNPNTRFFSSVNRLKSVLNAVNSWRGKLHDTLNRGKYISNEDLHKLLNEYPHSCPTCEEGTMLEHLIQAKEALEEDVENAIDTMSSVSYLLQLQKRVQQFEIPVKRSEDLDKKVEIATKMQERVNLIVNRSHSSDFPSVTELEQIKGHMIQYRVLLNHSGILETTITDSEKTSGLLTESVEGKTLEELESLLMQLKMSPLPQPQQEKSIANRVEKIKRFMSKQKDILGTLHPVENATTIEDLIYQPDRIPDFALYDASRSTKYRFPSAQYKTLSLFITKIKELHFAESDFQPILEKEKQYSTLLSRMNEMITSESFTREEICECLQSVLDAEIMVTNFHMLICRASAFFWNEHMKKELEKETMDSKRLAILLRDMNKIQLYVSSLSLNLQLEFENAEKARFILDHVSEWNLSVRKVLSGKQRSFEYAQELLQRGQELNMTRSSTYSELMKIVESCESWSARALELQSMERINISHYNALLEEKEQLLLNPVFDLQLPPLTASQKTWQKRVNYMAKTYYRLHTSATTDKRIKRKSESDIDMYLEEEKAFEFLFEDEILLLQEMKRDHESIKRECRFLLAKYSKALQALASDYPMANVDFAVESNTSLSQFWGECEPVENVLSDDWLLDTKDITESQPFMTPKDVTKQRLPSLFIETPSSSNRLTQLEASVNCAIHTEEEALNSIQQTMECVNHHFYAICQLNCTFLPDFLCVLNIMKTQYFLTKEEEDLESLLHAIHAIFTFYALLHNYRYPGLYSISKDSLYAKRKQMPLSDLWTMFQEEGENEMGESEMDLLALFQEESEDIPSLTLHHYVKMLQYLYVFRERPIGRQFALLFNYLFIPLFEEFYISIYLNGLYFREKPCFTLENVNTLLNLAFPLRCQCSQIEPLYTSLSIHNQWEDLLKQLYTKQIKLDSNRIAAFEKEVLSYHLPNNETLCELSDIMKESKELIATIQSFIDKKGIESFEEQRDYHRACKRARFIDLVPYQTQLEDVNTKYMCLCANNHTNSSIVLCGGCDQYFHAQCCNYQPKEGESFTCPLCFCEHMMCLEKVGLRSIVKKYVDSSVKPTFPTFVNESRDDPSLLSARERKRRKPAKDEEYTSYDDKINLRSDHATKRRKSERLSEKTPIEEEIIVPSPIERKTEESSLRIKYGRTPNALGDPEMNNFLKLFLSTPRLYSIDKWIIDCTSNKSNISSLKFLNPCHVNTLTEWMERVNAILMDIESATDVYEMTKQQTLPAHIHFLFFEYIRLSLDSEADATKVLTTLAYYVWYSYAHFVFQAPKDIHYWKRCTEMAKQLNILSQPLLTYVDFMYNRIERWNRGVAYVINPNNRQSTSLQYMQDLLEEANTIPAILNHKSRLESIVRDGAKARCYCRGYNDGSEMIHCRICNDLFHLKCLGIPKGGTITGYFKCEFCMGRRSREEMVRTVIQEQVRHEMMIPEQRALAILDRTSIHPNHYCRIVVSVNRNGTIKSRYI